MFSINAEDQATVRYIERRWRPLVEDIYYSRDDRHSDNNADLVLAVIAAESRGNQYAISSADARGLMQVMCFDWMNIDCDALYDPRFNIEWGIWFLDESMRFCEGWHTDQRGCGLRIYNCGYVGCAGNYMREVKYYWYPQFKRGGNYQPLYYCIGKICIQE